jgi:hypothetical protein
MTMADLDLFRPRQPWMEEPHQSKQEASTQTSEIEMQYEENEQMENEDDNLDINNREYLKI